MAVITMALKGLPMTRQAAEIDARGFAVFLFDDETGDVADLMNKARAQIFPDVSIPVIDFKIEAIMRARREAAELTSKTKKTR